MRRWVSALQPEMLLLGVLAAVAVTWPLALHPATRLPGCEYVGGYSHAWKYWWTARALLDQHVSPVHTTLINFPDGLAVGYYLASYLEAVWVLPVIRLFGPVAGVSVFTIGTLASSVWAGALLARWCGLGRGPTVLAVLAWVLAPHSLGFLMGGSPENLPTPWLPLGILGCLVALGLPRPVGPGDPRAERVARWSTPRRQALAAALAAICLLLQSLTTWFGGLMLALVAGGLWCAGAWARRREGLKGAWILAAGLAVGALGVAIAAHFLLPTVVGRSQGAWATWISTGWNWLRMTWKRSEPETQLFAAPTLWLNHHVLAGVWILAALGAATRGGRFWLLACIPFFLDILLPEALARQVVFDRPTDPSTLVTVGLMLAQHVERRLSPMHLFLALAAAHGLQWLVARVRARWRAILVPGAVLLWVVESLTLGPIRIPVRSFTVPVQPWAEHLATAESGGVIDLPILVQVPNDESTYISSLIKAIRSRYLFAQTVHGQPILAAIGTRLDMEMADLPVQDPLLSALAITGNVIQGRHFSVHSAWNSAHLRKEGFRWVVLHRDLIVEDARVPMEAELRHLLGEPLEFGSALVWRLPEPDRVVQPRPESSVPTGPPRRPGEIGPAGPPGPG